MSQEDLAARIGMSRPHLSRIENGVRPYTQDFLEAASQALRCSVVSLLIQDPADPEGLWDLYDQLDSSQRRHLVEIGRTFLTPAHAGSERALMVAEDPATFKPKGRPGAATSRRRPGEP